MNRFIFLAIYILLCCSCGNSQKNTVPAPVYSDTTTVYFNSTAAMKSSKIPDSVFLMRNLETLSITGMDCDYRQFDKDGKDITQCWAVSEIPKQIGSLVNLQNISLTVNNVHELPAEMNALHKLKLLDLTDNPSVKNIEVVTTLTSLEELYLYGCQMTTLPANIGALRHLKKLGLTGNYLTDKELERIKKALPGCVVVFSK